MNAKSTNKKKTFKKVQFLTLKEKKKRFQKMYRDEI